MFSHHHLHSIEYDSFEFNEVVDIDYPYKNKTSGCVEVLSGPCNGLMFLPFGGIFFLWNPSTKEFKKLPKTYIEICEEIRADNYGDATVDREVKVYTLGTNSWNNVADVPQNLLYDGQSGVFKEVLRFDDMFKPMSLHTVGGCLCTLSYCDTNGIEEWVMKDYGVKGTWTKLSTNIGPSELHFSDDDVKVLYHLKNGEILLQKDHDDLVLYDPKSQKVKTLGKQDLFSPGFEAEIYVGSLVSLNSGTYVEGKGELTYSSLKLAKTKIPFGRKSMLEAYADILFLAWKVGEGLSGEEIENGFLEGEPVIFRSLQVANSNVRKNALHLLLDMFPLEDPDATKEVKDALLDKQFFLLEKLLLDECPNMRVVVVGGSCHILYLFWEVISSSVITKTISKIVDDMSQDACTEIRLSTLNGIIYLLGNPQTHEILEVLLPRLGHLFLDSVLSVRAAFIDLLLTLRV
ncbi:hypothetical protein IFM89_032986 [Coptis chinensis]|uniref:Uncharacterized protein n=1 Tax=Coptis chinensis TaxID=261450 RepID=A0A835HTK5_9MAGN|nr:hypothetical protein IFM89_032986 [Coptis chinensis]